MLAFAQTNYGVTYRMHAKIEVNGKGAHPLYEHLKTEARGLLGTAMIKWNFTKFIVDKQGKVLERHAPKTKPDELVARLTGLLGT